MEFLKAALQNIQSAATSPLAFAAYVIVIIAWLVIAWRVQRNKQLLESLQKLPAKDRLSALQQEMGSVPVPPGLTPEQWLKSRTQKYVFSGFALFCLIVIVLIGVSLTRAAFFATFPLTVYVHGQAGPQDIVLRNSGSVLLDLGGDRRSQPIGAEGQAYFSEIPSSFRGHEVPIGLESNDFELSDPKRMYRLNGAGIYVPIKKRDGRISGRVEDDNGNPLSGAKVQVGDLPPATSDSAGHFELVIPGDRLKPQLDLQASVAGYGVKHYQVVPGANDLVVQLNRTP